MNIPAGNLTAAATISAIDQVHVWRSKFIDCASRCETRLRLLHKAQSASCDAFLQIKSLALAIRASDQSCPKLVRAIDELLPLIELRAALAHSVVTLLNFNAQQTAVFVNADNKATFGRNALLMDVEEREVALKKIKSIAERLKRQQKTTDEPEPIDC